MIRAALFSPGVHLLLRLILAGVLVVAAVPKLLAPAEFAQVIDGYGLTPAFINPVLAVALPLAELVLAVMLVLNSRGAVIGTTLLLAVFSMVLGYGIFIGLDVDCGCFGPEDPERDAFHGLDLALRRDLLLLVCCCWLYSFRFFTTKATGSRSPRQTARGMLR